MSNPSVQCHKKLPNQKTCKSLCHHNTKVSHFKFSTSASLVRRMDDLQFYIPFISISVISWWWVGDYERLCATEPHLRFKKIPPQAGLGLLDQQASANPLIYRGLLSQSGGSPKVGRVASHERVYIHLLYCAYVLGHIKTINFPFVTNGTIIIFRHLT